MRNSAALLRIGLPTHVFGKLGETLAGIHNPVVVPQAEDPSAATNVCTHIALPQMSEASKETCAAKAKPANPLEESFLEVGHTDPSRCPSGTDLGSQDYHPEDLALTIPYYDGEDKDFQLIADGANPPEDEAAKTQAEKVKTWFRSSRHTMTEWAVHLAEATQEGIFVYLEIVHNMRDVAGVEAKCKGDNLWRHVKREHEKFSPGVKMIRLAAPKQIIREVESDLLIPQTEDPDKVDANTGEETLSDMFPLLLYVKKNLNPQAKVQGRRTSNLTVRGDNLGNSCYKAYLEAFFKMNSSPGICSDDDPTRAGGCVCGMDR